MTIVHECGTPGCETLTIGAYCLQHEALAARRLRSRSTWLLRQAQRPAITTVAVVVAAALAGRLSGRLG